MRILFAGLALPYPPMNGHRLRTWAMVRALADDGHAVRLVAFAEPDEMRADLRPLRDLCEVVDLVPAPPALSAPAAALGRALAVPSREPFGVRKFRSPAFTQRLEKHLADTPVDALICDGVYNAQNLPPSCRVPTLLNKDDVAHLIIRRYLALERHPLRRLYGALEAAKVEAWERRTLRTFSTTLACSAFDRALLHQMSPTADIRVVPNVVDTDHYTPRPGAEPLTVLFQGGMDWHPNRDAAQYFAEAVLPELRGLVPSVRFRIAGRTPSTEFRRHLERLPSVEFTGTVLDMRNEIARATVCVIPLRIGSGTRLKILEAGAMGKAMVSTTIGAEGLSLNDGEEIIIADRPAGLAAALARLLHDARLREELGRAARLAVERRHGLTVFRTSMREAIAASLLASHSPTTRTP